MQKEDFSDLYALEEKFWWFAGMREIAASVLDDFCESGNLKVLDAGCGTGLNLEWLRRYAPPENIFGLDYSADAIDFCKERNLKNLVQGSATDLPFADESFDLITSFDVLVQLFCFDHKEIEVVVQLGCAASNVEIFYLRIHGENFKTALDGFTSHHLRSFGSGIDMAMLARLVAELANVHLKCLNVQGFQVEFMFSEFRFKFHRESFHYQFAVHNSLFTVAAFFPPPF